MTSTRPRTDQRPVDAVAAPDLRLSARLGRWLVTDTRREADESARVWRSAHGDARASRDVTVILVTCAVCLTISNFWADATSPGWLVSPMRAVGLDRLASNVEGAVTGEHAEFNRLAWWGTVQIASYVVLPTIVIRTLLRGRVRDYGLAVRGIGAHVLPYAFLIAVAVPFVVAASFSSGFQAKYPFYDLAPAEGLWPYLWAWWGLYALQFVALEFFFRGFLVHGLTPRIGYAGMLVMLVPYNMIHYGKPMPEAFAAIVGGFVLGSLSLKTRSIWLGAGVHIAIAGTMDVLALTHAGVLF